MREMRTHIVLETLTVEFSGRRKRRRDRRKNFTPRPTDDEYVLMARAGLSRKQLLASLTTAPAERFGESARRGRAAAGMDADLVVLAGDPLDDVRNFARVRYTIRAGRVIHPLP